MHIHFKLINFYRYYRILPYLLHLMIYQMSKLWHLITIKLEKHSFQGISKVYGRLQIIHFCLEYHFYSYHIP